METRPDLAMRVRERGAALGCAGLIVVEAELAAAELPEREQVLVALHACDTATDDALLLAIERQVDHVAVVPCRQAEVASQLSGKSESDPVLGVEELLSRLPEARPKLVRELGLGENSL